MCTHAHDLVAGGLDGSYWKAVPPQALLHADARGLVLDEDRFRPVTLRRISDLAHQFGELPAPAYQVEHVDGAFLIDLRRDADRIARKLT